ncbi:hypothetical protein L1987_57331 [Smallanthus sonchifolius]|uniref:Uncharacterized protein n=1 Tax=Smallanthus sonchifolius TaxID=185202 RepID=A0ACB9DCB7_9ASTR|nr:hypothetical protein L1987_57331 [Smallanthus sonchifolius]
MTRNHVGSARAGVRRLTLELGLQKIKDAVQELKSKSCSAKAGFQIAVSPGSKALSWFCCQDPSLGVFPQFFASTGVEKYQTVDSTHLMAYGLFENKSLYMFIPQIELVESDSLSILTATLAWDDSSLRAYEEAFDAIFYLTTADNCLNRCVSSVLRKFNMMVDEHAQMENASLSSQFSLRLSSTITVSNNMLDQSRDINSLKGSSNINTLWASLMIEEWSCSSPLAIAATSHPMISCIACIDERSLAFHAIGYARGCHKPAVVIKSSGTADLGFFQIDEVDSDSQRAPHQRNVVHGCDSPENGKREIGGASPQQMTYGSARRSRWKRRCCLVAVAVADG